MSKSKSKSNAKAGTRVGAVGDRAYYKNPKFEVADIWDAYGLDVYRALIIKYLCRINRKPGESEVTDLDKSLWYLTRLRDQAVKREKAAAKATKAKNPVRSVRVR